MAALKRIFRRTDNSLSPKHDQGQMSSDLQLEAKRETASRELCELPEIRLVLLGGRNSGKSSAGNTILGKVAFLTETTRTECVRAQSKDGGKMIVVVDTPGWDYCQTVPVQEQVKQQLASSLDLCRPGPHAFLLVFPVASDVMTKRVKAHMELLGPDSWDYTLMLFTCGDRLKCSTIEGYVESQGKALKNLVEKCGNRIHVLNNYNKQDRSQVKKLLDKIENMAWSSSGSYYHSRLCQQEQEQKQQTDESKRDKEKEAANVSPDVGRSTKLRGARETKQSQPKNSHDWVSSTENLDRHMTHGDTLLELTEVMAQFMERLGDAHKEEVRWETERQSVAAAEQNRAALEEIQRLKIEVEELRNTCQEKEGEMEKLREKNVEKDRDMQTLRDSCEEGEQEKEKLRLELSAVRLELSNLMSETEELRRQHEEKIREAEQYKAILQQFGALAAQVSLPSSRE